jgi:hypothetical protein
MLQKIFTMLTKQDFSLNACRFSNEKCQGGKKSKDRLTVMVCCNMTGNDKIEFLVIGKSQIRGVLKRQIFTSPILRQQKSLDDLGTV